MAEWERTPVDYDPFAGTVDATAKLAPYQPTFRDRIAQWMLGDAKASPERTRAVEGVMGSRGLGSTGMGIVDATPAGLPLALNDARGDVHQAAIAMAIPPGVRAAAAPVARAVTAEAPAGIRAYHGSPHDFERFSMDKLGSGAGAQVYSHGLYFAENEATSKYYRDYLTQDRIGVAQRALVHNKNDVDATIAQFQNEINRIKNIPNKGNDPEVWARKIKYNQEALDEVLKFKQNGKFSTGSMYEVNIKADPEKFIDWDKPLSPENRAIVQNLMNEHDPAKRVISEKMTGADAYSMLKQTMKDNIGYPKMFSEPNSKPAALASKELNQAGVPGIKYFDDGAPRSGVGPRNYVVFNDDLIEIIRKYGLAGVGVLPPATAAAVRSQMTPVDHDPFSNGGM